MLAKDMKGNDQHDLFWFHIKTGGMKQLTDMLNAQEVPVDISPDGNWLAHSVNESIDLVNEDIWLVNSDGSEKHLLIQAKESSKEQLGD